MTVTLCGDDKQNKQALRGDYQRRHNGDDRQQLDHGKPTNPTSGTSARLEFSNYHGIILLRHNQGISKG